MSRVLNVASSIGSTVARLGSGLRAQSIGKRPEQRLILYEFEGCPFCRKVREALTHLDLEAEIRPCPKRGKRYREECIQRGGKASFPYLVDPNGGKEMYESEEIVEWLYREYGAGPVPRLQRGMFPILTGSLASGIRAAAGTFGSPSKPPEKLLELWSFEASPYCRIVRERLCELEIAYVLHNVGRGSENRPDFIQRSGKMQVPYLYDPNTQTGLFESADIVSYLDETYSSRESS